VGRRIVEVIVIFLDVLPVVALAVGQAEQPLLEDRILAVPQRDREAQPLLLVADPGDPVPAPVIGARPGLIVAEIIPGVAVRAVILTDRAPLAFAEIGSPQLPRHALGARLVQAQILFGLGTFPHGRRIHRSSRPFARRPRHGRTFVYDPD